ncbi:50S ribosome-binding GTPase [Candidatus Woesearchaeota archaeon]|nr:50S ribosome-binding GTPase [Candidatus Woesearchaeota archaeon]
MNFQDLKKIEKPDFYLDVAFRKANEAASKVKLKQTKDKERKIKEIELQKIDTAKQVLVNYLEGILKAYPSFRHLDEFYLELVKCTLDYPKLKKSLGAVNWCSKKTTLFFRKYNRLLRKSTKIKEIHDIKKAYYGRVSSLFKQIEDNLSYLEEARRVMRNYPTLKTSMFTVCITGFPNVGKTTLLSKLTSSQPEIDSYPFTTKTLNVGYLKEGYKKIQLVDTPGTLNRFNKMNNIEKQAYLAIEHLADAIIYVFDLTEAYPIADQTRLFEKLKDFNKNTIVFVSKKDITDKKMLDKFKQSYKMLTDIEELKQQLFGLIQE